MLPIEIRNKLNEFFQQKGSKDFAINNLASVSGGSINQTAKIETNIGKFFIKWNELEKYPKMFEKEAQGLEILAKSEKIRIPKIILQEEMNTWSFLVLEWIETAEKNNGFWEDFGRKMSELHKISFEKYGFENDNYIGSLHQRNHWDSDWEEFFWVQRIEPMLTMARNKGYADRGDTQSFDSLFYKLDKLFPKEKPSLLHGDFWKGNFLVDNKGNPCLIDPAVYFGHREMDLSMSQLFGGFPTEFYKSYHQNFPLEPDWEERTDLWNLYPLLVHAILFGESYMNEVRRNVRRFI
jgi:protein-ribulosamine 3-kinase